MGERIEGAGVENRIGRLHYQTPQAKDFIVPTENPAAVDFPPFYPLASRLASPPEEELPRSQAPPKREGGNKRPVLEVIFTRRSIATGHTQKLMQNTTAPCREMEQFARGENALVFSVSSLFFWVVLDLGVMERTGSCFAFFRRFGTPYASPGPHRFVPAILSRRTKDVGAYPQGE